MATFRTLIECLCLERDEIGTVAKAKNNLIDILYSKGQNGFLPRALDDFLTGSYARGTKIRPLDDVDIFFVIGTGETNAFGTHNIVKCNYEFDSSFYDIQGNLSSRAVLSLFKREIEKTYTRSEVARDGEVVNVYLSSYGVGFDVVPTFYISDANYFLMPTGRGSAKWKKSNPKIDIRVSEQLNAKHNSLIINLVRIIKYWFRVKRIKSPRSYYIEAMVYQVFHNLPPTNNYNQALQYFFLFLSSEHLEYCPDPTGISGNMSSNLDLGDIDRILKESINAQIQLLIGDDAFVRYLNPNL